MTGTTRWLDADQQETWQTLVSVVMGLPVLLDRQLQRDAGISHFEYTVLSQLSMVETLTMRLSELAARCNSTLPRLSKAMVRFEQHGWVTRTPDPHNGRFTLATLTDAGHRKVVDTAPAHVDEVRRLVFDPLTAVEQRHLSAALTRLADPVREQLTAL